MDQAVDIVGIEVHGINILVFGLERKHLVFPVHSK
jgi:hypothetical protein